MGSRVVVGVDPGVTGGIAILDGSQAKVHPMPTMPNPNGRGRTIDAHRVRDIIKAAVSNNGEPPWVILERQQAMPRQGVVSTFSTGMGVGIIYGISCALGAPIEMVQVKTWQSAMFRGMPHKDTKAASIRRCKELFPQVCLLPTPKCTRESHGLADALLLAAYGHRTLVACAPQLGRSLESPLS